MDGIAGSEYVMGPSCNVSGGSKNFTSIALVHAEGHVGCKAKF